MFLILVCMTNWTTQLKAQIAPESEFFYAQHDTLRYNYPDSMLQLLDEHYQSSMDRGDSIEAVTALCKAAEIHSHHARYKMAYDNLWLALKISDATNEAHVTAGVYRRLGRIYSYYKRKNEALKYFDIALEIDRDLVLRGMKDSALLLRNYLTKASTYRELKNPDLAKKYLDSCLYIYDKDEHGTLRPYLLFELAVVRSSKQDYEEALRLMKEVEVWFTHNKPSYGVLVFSYIGDIYKDLKDYNRSINYYTHALAISEEYSSHLDFTPLIHQKLAEIYHLTGNPNKAYTSLEKARQLDEKYFDSRSQNNLPLLEIQDAFRIEKEQQAEQLRIQRLEQLEQENKVSLLQRAILIVVILSLILVGFLIFRNVRTKHKAEKQLIRRKQEMERQKANEILEIKNKELVASAVQVLERDELLSELREKLHKQKVSPDPAELGKIVKTIDLSSSRDWEEFETRFTAVNQSFYDSLREKFPDLTSNDHRLCALIKLNFSSKDMARLMGISIESIHTNRYRLRKKFDIERHVNLEDFIAKI